MSSNVVEVFRGLSAHFGSGSVTDPYPVFAEKRRESPVSEGDILTELGALSFAGRHQGPVFTLFRYDDITAAFRDTTTYSSGIYAQFGVARGMVGMDGAEHRLWRSIVNPVFSNRALAGWDTDTLQPLAERMVAHVAPAKRTDLTDFAVRFPIRAIYEILGFAGDADGFDEFAQLTAKMVRSLAVDPKKPDEMREILTSAAEAAETLLARAQEVVERKRASNASGNDLITHLINADFEGRKLDDEEIASFVSSVMQPSTETTSRMFLNSLACLMSRPELLEEVRRDRSLLPAVHREAERYEATAMAVPRITVADVEVRGVTIPSGAVVQLCVGSANRDENTYANADEFIMGREGPPAMTFGFGSHICPGANTSRREIVAMLNAVLDLPGLRIDPESEAPSVRGVNLRTTGAFNVVWD